MSSHVVRDDISVAVHRDSTLCDDAQDDTPEPTSDMPMDCDMVKDSVTAPVEPIYIDHGCHAEPTNFYKSTGTQAVPLMLDKTVQWEDQSLLLLEEHNYCKTYTRNASLSTEGTQTVAVLLHKALSKVDYRFYTGIEMCAFLGLVTAVAQTGSVKHAMSLADQVLLVLMRLRLGLLYHDLANRFGVSVYAVGSIFRHVRLS